MKIKPEHYAHMRDAISNLVASRRTDVESHASAIRSGLDERVKDTEKRIRWDLCHAARLSPFLCQSVYPYADDNHVDTALRKIVSDLGI